MTRENYTVQYVAFGADNKVIKHGRMRVKNRLSKFDAMAGLEKHFNKVLPGFTKLTVLNIKVETADTFLDMMTNLIYKK